MIIYNTSILKNTTTTTTAYNPETIQPKPHLKRSVLQKPLTASNKKFLKSLNLKLKTK